MRQVSREKAVEAAKEFGTVSMMAEGPETTEFMTRHGHTMRDFILQSAPPAEAFDARAFVRKAMHSNICYLDELTAELSALIAAQGRAGDGGEAVTPTSILRELIDDLQVPNSLGVDGSDFTTCLGCNGGSYPGHEGYVHAKNCPVEKAEKALAGISN